MMKTVHSLSVILCLLVLMGQSLLPLVPLAKSEWEGSGIALRSWGPSKIPYFGFPVDVNATLYNEMDTDQTGLEVDFFSNYVPLPAWYVNIPSKKTVNININCTPPESYTWNLMLKVPKYKLEAHLTYRVQYTALELNVTTVIASIIPIGQAMHFNGSITNHIDYKRPNEPITLSLSDGGSGRNLTSIRHDFVPHEVFRFAFNWSVPSTPSWYQLTLYCPSCKGQYNFSTFLAIDQNGTGLWAHFMRIRHKSYMCPFSKQKVTDKGEVEVEVINVGGVEVRDVEVVVRDQQGNFKGHGYIIKLESTRSAILEVPVTFVTGDNYQMNGSLQWNSSMGSGNGTVRNTQLIKFNACSETACGSTYTFFFIGTGMMGLMLAVRILRTRRRVPDQE